MSEQQIMDPTLIAGLVGAGGSVAGALVGALIAYKLNNSKPKLKAYIDNRLVIYYLKNTFCIYVPITVINEGNKSGTVSDFKVKLTSANQTWELNWLCFSEDNTLKGESWKDIRRASPILVHGNSGIQCPIKLIESINDSAQQHSNIVLGGGKSLLSFEYYDRNLKVIESQRYSFEMPTSLVEALAQRRKDYECNETVIVPLKMESGENA